MNISKDWKPTPENINKLPKPIHNYIHDLTSLCDPAGIMFKNGELKLHIKQLEAYIEFLKKTTI